MPQFGLSLDDERAEVISHRKSILFDVGVWISLSDGKCEESRVIRNRVRKLVRTEKVFAPLCPPSLWELRKQQGKSLAKCTELMEEFSLNISFRSAEQIFENEIVNFLNYILSGQPYPLPAKSVYGPLLCYLSDKIDITPSPDVPLEEQRNQIMHIRSSLERMGVSEYVRLTGGGSCPFPQLDGRFQQASINRRKLANASTNWARRIEQENIALSVILPKLNRARRKLPITLQAEVFRKIEELRKSRRYKSAIEHILRFCPALSAYVETMTLSELDISRKDNPNDFFDKELVVYGLSYPSIFTSFDGWIKSLVDMALQHGVLGGLAFSSSLSSLGVQLEAIENEI